MNIIHYKEIKIEKNSIHKMASIISIVLSLNMI